MPSLPRQYHLQSNFSAGMLSPRMLGYEDTQAYQSGAKLLENFIVEPQGSLTKRPGTYFASETKDSTAKPRLYPFNFGQGQAYVLEFGENYIRFYQNSGPVLVDVNGGTCTADAGTDKISLTAHGLSNGDQVWFSSTGTLPAPLKASIRYFVVNKGTNDFQVALTSGGSAINLTSTGSGTHTCQKHLEVTTTYSETEVQELSFAQSADYLFIVHPDHQQAALIRASATSWSLSDYDLVDGPYLDTNTTATTLAASATSGTATITASSATGVNGGSGFLFTDVGRHLRICNPATGIQWGWGTITGGSPLANTCTADAGTDFITSVGHGMTNGTPVWFLSTGTVPGGLVAGTTYYVVNKTVDTFQVALTAGGSAIDLTSAGSGTITGYNGLKCVISISQALPSGTADTRWALGAFSDTTGWPRSVAIYQQRLVFAGTDTDPQGVWFSKTGLINTFSPTEFEGVQGENDSSGTAIVIDQILDDNAVTVYIQNDTVDRIEWMKEGKKLAIGSTGGIFVLYGSNDNQTVTPFNVTVERSTEWAVEPGVLPARIGNAMLYVQKNGRKLREWSFVAQADQYEAVDLTIRADSLTVGKIAGLAFQDQPGSVLWCMMADGALRGLTYIKEIETFAWHRHVLGGAFGSGDPVVDSLCVIPTGTYDQLWMVVKRTINGATVRYVEYLEQAYSDGQTNQHYVDCGLAYAGSAADTLAGLDHLEGAEVALLGDNAVQPAQVVDDGSVTLSSEVTAAAIGLAYSADLQTLPISTGELKQTFIGGIKRVDQITLRLYASMGIKFGYNTSELDEIIFRLSTDNTGEAVPLFTGDQAEQMRKGNTEEETRGELYLRAHQPTPVTLLALAIAFEVSMP